MSKRLPLASLAVAAGLLAGAAPAQLLKGTTAPAFDFDAGWNDAPASFAQLEGKLVLLDFFGTA